MRGKYRQEVGREECVGGGRVVWVGEWELGISLVELKNTKCSFHFSSILKVFKNCLNRFQGLSGTCHFQNFRLGDVNFPK